MHHSQPTIGAKKGTSPRVPTWSPTAVLPEPGRVSLLKADGFRSIHASMKVPSTMFGALWSIGLSPIGGEVWALGCSGCVLAACSKVFSRGRFRSCGLWVMGPSRSPLRHSAPGGFCCACAEVLGGDLKDLKD